MRRFLISTVLIAVIAGAPGAAWGATTIAPHQAFVGRVNGQFANATVTVVCPGPARGESGHPAGNQPLEVISPPPPGVPNVSVGNTGSAGRRIVAIITIPSGQVVVAATFHKYFASIDIPTSLTLPCEGSGVVSFVPEPSSSSSKASTVKVTFLNPAA